MSVIKVLIIIPAYNEEENIVKVVENLRRNYCQYDYIVINDGSKDSTAQICKKNKYNMLDLPCNIGLAGAFQAGMMYAYENNYDFTIQFDGDGQHRAEYINDLMKCAYETNKDIIIGSRFKDRKKEKSLRMLGSNIISYIINITTRNTIKDPTSGMRLYSKNIIREFAQNINYGPEPDTLAFLMINGIKCEEIQVEMDERIAGESYLNFKNSTIYMIKMCISILCIQWFRKREVRENVYNVTNSIDTGIN